MARTTPFASILGVLLFLLFLLFVATGCEGNQPRVVIIQVSPDGKVVQSTDSDGDVVVVVTPPAMVPTAAPAPLPSSLWLLEPSPTSLDATTSATTPVDAL